MEKERGRRALCTNMHSSGSAQSQAHSMSSVWCGLLLLSSCCCCCCCCSWSPCAAHSLPLSRFEARSQPLARHLSPPIHIFLRADFSRSNTQENQARASSSKARPCPLLSFLLPPSSSSPSSFLLPPSSFLLPPSSFLLPPSSSLLLSKPARQLHVHTHPRLHL